MYTNGHSSSNNASILTTLFNRDALSNITRYLPSHVVCRLFLVGNRALTYQLEHGGITEVTHFIRDLWSHPLTDGDIFPRFLLSRLNMTTNKDIHEEHLESFTVISLPEVHYSLPQLKWDHPSLDPSQLSHLHIYDPHCSQRIHFSITDDKKACNKLNLHNGACDADRPGICYMAAMWRLLPRSKLQSLSVTLPDLFYGYYILPLFFEHFQSDGSGALKFPSSLANLQDDRLSPSPSRLDLTLPSSTTVPILDAPVLSFPKLVFLKLHGSNEESIMFEEIMSAIVVPQSLARFEYSQAVRNIFDDEDCFRPSPYHVGTSNAPKVPSSDSHYALLDRKLLIEITGDRLPGSWTPPLLPQVWSPNITRLKIDLNDLSQETVSALPRSLTHLSVEVRSLISLSLNVDSHQKSHYPHSLTFLCIIFGPSTRHPLDANPYWALSLPPKLKSLWIDRRPSYRTISIHSYSIMYMPPSLEYFWFYRCLLTVDNAPEPNLISDRLSQGSLSNIRSLSLRSIEPQVLTHLTSIEHLSIEYPASALPSSTWLPLKSLRYLQIGYHQIGNEIFVIGPETAKALATLPLETLHANDLDCTFDLLPRTLTTLILVNAGRANFLNKDGFASLPQGLLTLVYDCGVWPCPGEWLLTLPPGLTRLELGKLHDDFIDHLHALPPTLKHIDLSLWSITHLPKFDAQLLWTLPHGLTRPLTFCKIGAIYLYAKEYRPISYPTKLAISNSKL